MRLHLLVTVAATCTLLGCRGGENGPDDEDSDLPAYTGFCSYVNTVDDVSRISSEQTFDQASQLVHTMHFFLGDLDNQLTYEYDGDGNMVVRKQDMDGDGFYEQRLELDWDERGNKIWELQDADVEDDDIDRVFTYEWDAADRLVRFTTDVWNDGVVDMFEDWTYADDGDGRTQRAERFSNGETEPDYTAEYTYDDEGRVVTIALSVSGATGEITHTYDEAGNLVRTRADYPNRQLSISEWDHDELGRQVAGRFGSSDDGSWTQTCTYEYLDGRADRTVADCQVGENHRVETWDYGCHE